MDIELFRPVFDYADEEIHFSGRYFLLYEVVYVRFSDFELLIVCVEGKLLVVDGFEDERALLVTF